MPTLYHAKQNVYIRRSLKQFTRHKGCTARSSDLRKEHSHDGTRELRPYRRVFNVAVFRIQGLSKGLFPCGILQLKKWFATKNIEKTETS